MADLDNIKSRVMILADTLGIGRKRMVEQIGMTYSNFTGKARTTPLNSNAVANILSLHPEVNAYWLLTGDGDILTAGYDAASQPHSQRRKGSERNKSLDAPRWLINERRTHNEIVLSQQRTIEKLVAYLGR
jgi:hypothetical protein